MALPNPTDLAVPGFVALVLIEMVAVKLTHPERYEPRDTLTSLSLGLGNVVSGVIFGGLLGAFALWVWNYRLFDIGWQWYWFVIAFVVDDFFYYLVHRAGHRIRWLWASHVIHHSSQHYNLSTALRQTWTGPISLGIVIKIPLFLIGFHPAMLAFVGGLNLIYQFWIHTEAIDKMPRWFEAVMNTPSHHRVHHATNPRYLDKNYAGVFIVWDKWLGTFEPERADDPPRYGIVKNLGSFNLLWAAFHEWIGIARDVWAAPTLKAKLGYMVMPPGWSHDGSRDTSEIIKARWLQRQQQEQQLGSDAWKKPTSSSSAGDPAGVPSLGG
ncbi:MULTISPECIES: sterol desaturase family protein [Sphingomonas]|uniref:sterol desaturase family protein n=1 Tax=Sphingomonas TaxID=13687 RepID=UPI00082F7212|nr:sterol desaturase family protein [Sphingomonas sp. CCH10-B3]MBA3879115.1 sterol desaturase family protein [Sphingobium sp.]